MCSKDRLKQIQENAKTSIADEVQLDFEKTKEEMLDISNKTTRLFRSMLL